MPFTISHAAAALPFRRVRLIPSALVVGTFAPDIEYFVRLAPGGGWGHTLPGAFGLSLPLGLITLWMYHRFIKVPASYLAPTALQRRICVHLGHFPFLGFTRFVLILASILFGVATHICWDSFTHSNTWLYDHSTFLHRHISVLSFRFLPVFEILQYLSSAIGVLALWRWFVRWYASAATSAETLKFHLPFRQRTTIIALMGVVALLTATLRAYIGVGVPEDHKAELTFYGEFIVTSMAMLWWQLLIWGFFFRSRAFRAVFASEEPYTQARS